MAVGGPIRKDSEMKVYIVIRLDRDGGYPYIYGVFLNEKKAEKCLQNHKSSENEVYIEYEEIRV